MRAKKQAFAVRLLLSVVMAAAFSASATARGFCNIDGLGSKELQQDVRNAGATFFEAGSYMMTMLSAFERDDSDKIKTAGSDAVMKFGNATELYKAVKIPEDIDKKPEVNVETAGCDSASAALHSLVF